MSTPPKTGYSTITVKNKVTGVTVTSTGSGCPPGYGLCTGPIPCAIGDTLHIEGYLKKCDGTGWTHSELGQQVIRIKTGACGDPGEDIDLATGLSHAGPYGSAMFDFDFNINTDVFAWLTRQKDRGWRSSIYQQASIDYSGWYSSEVSLTIGVVEHTTPAVWLHGPTPLTEHTTPYVKLAAPSAAEHTTPYVKLVGPGPPIEHTTPAVKLNAVLVGEHVTPYVKLSKSEGPPPPLNCEERFPGRNTPLSWDAIGYALCIVFQSITSTITPFLTAIGTAIGAALNPFLQPWLNFVTTVTGIGTAVSLWIKDPWAELQKVIDTTWAVAWSTFETWANGATFLWVTISKPITDALAKIKIELPDWLGGFQTWLENLPDLVSGGLEWVTHPAKKLAETAAAMVAEESPSAFVSMANILKAGYVQVPPKTPDWKLAPVTLWVEKTVHEWVQKWRARIIELAEENADDPATFSQKLTDEILYLETDAIATGMDLEMASLGLLEGGARVIDIVLNYIGGGPITHIHDQTAIAESIAITSQQYWANKFRKHLPGTGDIINQVVKEIIELDEFKRLMGLQGFSETQAQRIWDAHFIAPARQELVTALRRGKITREAWDRLKILVDLDPRYDHINADTGEAGTGSFSIWDEMVYDDPGLSNLRFMYESGAATDEELPVYLKALGYRPEHIPALETYIKEYQGRFFRRRQLTLLTRMVKAGKITEDEFIAKAKTIYYTEKTARLELENQALASELSEGAAERIAQLGSINSWYTEDIISAATYRDSAHTLLYSDDFIDNQLTYLDKKKAPPPPTPEKIAEATRAMYDTYYVEDIIDSAVWRAYYVTQKYPVDVIDLQLAYLDKKKTPPEPPPVDLETERDLLQSEAIAAFKKHIIDETVLRDRLDKLGRSDNAINVLVAIAKADMATEQRDATLAVYSKAYRQGAILRSDYLAKLIDNTYTPDAAELIVQTEELSWGTGVEALTAEQTLNAWEQGFLTLEETTDRLRKAGWTDSDMKIRLSFSVIDMLKAKHITAAEADKLWTDFGLGPEERARLAAWYGGTPA